MAEEESENPSRERSAENTFVWSNLPKDVQLQVLSNLSIELLCRMRCVCKEWRDVIHRGDFRRMYDMMHSSENPSPAICYAESSYPSRLEWSSYDCSGKTWKKMSSFPRLTPQINPGELSLSQNQYNFYSVGGLLCLSFWKRDKSDPSFLCRGARAWLVWHPFRNKWKKLPPCKHKVSMSQAPLFVHTFVSDERAKTYKIVMAHDPKCHQSFEDTDDADRKLVTEIYDSATGRWAEGSEYRIQYPSLQFGSSQRGVLCNGVVYFVTASTRHNYVLLSYNTAADQWHEDHYSMSDSPVFEWDGCLMSIASRESELHEFSQDDRINFVVQWDPVARSWKETGIEVPFKVRSKFQRGMEGTDIVASGNHMVVAGYSWEDSLKIAVYKRAENYWRLPPSAAFSDKMRLARVEGLVTHKPSLDWRP